MELDTLPHPDPTLDSARDPEILLGRLFAPAVITGTSGKHLTPPQVQATRRTAADLLPDSFPYVLAEIDGDGVLLVRPISHPEALLPVNVSTAMPWSALQASNNAPRATELHKLLATVRTHLSLTGESTSMPPDHDYRPQRTFSLDWTRNQIFKASADSKTSYGNRILHPWRRLWTAWAVALVCTDSGSGPLPAISLCLSSTRSCTREHFSRMAERSIVHKYSVELQRFGQRMQKRLKSSIPDLILQNKRHLRVRLDRALVPAHSCLGSVDP